jgi:pyridoxamine 5'-phosphate oxidase
MMDDLKDYISRLREDFTKGTLDESSVSKDPFQQFEQWLKQAVEAQILEVQAMTLSTVSEEGKPSSRIVYLREFENGRFWFYGNYESRKGKQLAANPNACINFFWPQLERQIRIEGTVTIGDAQHSDNYYNKRPQESQIGAWASPQSTPLKSRSELEARVDHFKNKFNQTPIARPPYWGGWILNANYYEFWQGRKSRLHDRICYRLADDKWQISRLAP